MSHPFTGSTPRHAAGTRHADLGRWGFAALLLLCAVAFFPHNTALPSDIMESRNLVTAREMAEEGHWLVPTMNGQLRLEKPPLPTWIAGAVEAVCPDNLALQRAMAGLAGCLLVLSLFLLARRLLPDGRYGLLAALLLLTCYSVVQMGRLATWDIYCHAFMMAAIYLLYRGLSEERHARRRLLAAGLWMGLSFLSKGPVSFYALLLPFLLALPLLGTCRLRGRRGALAAMTLVCVAVSAWWYVYILVAHPDLAQQVIHKESASWANHNVRPWHYYLQHVSEFGVWTALFCAALAYPLWHSRLRQPRVYRFALAWTLLQLLLLSLMPEKKPRYLLPMMMPGCLAMACLVRHWAEEPRRTGGLSRAFLLLNQSLLLLVPPGVGAGVTWLWREGMAELWLMILTWAVALLLCGWMAVGMARRRAGVMVTATALLFAYAEAALMPAAGRLFNNPDRHSIALTHADKRLDALPFYHNAAEEMQIETVCQARRKILPVSLARLPELPCVMVTARPLGEELPAAALDSVQATFIDRYDDSTAWRLQRHRGRNFIYYVTLLEPKK